MTLGSHPLTPTALCCWEDTMDKEQTLYTPPPPEVLEWNVEIKCTNINIFLIKQHSLGKHHQEKCVPYINIHQAKWITNATEVLLISAFRSCIQLSNYAS